MSTRTSWIAWIIAALVAGPAGFWVARQLDSSAPQLASGTWLPVPRQVGEIHLTSDNGQPFTLDNLRGHPSLMFFGFTQCPDVCPVTLAKLAQIKKAAALPGLQVLFVSVDPLRDTPAVLAPYVHAFDPSFIGLTGTPEAIAALTRSFEVAVSRVDLPGGGYTMDHSAVVFLLDSHARVDGVFTPPYEAAPFAADLRKLASRLRS